MYQVEVILSTLYQIYFYMVIVYILMSWLPNARESFIGELLGKFVEPYLSPFRRFIPPLFGVLDISPIVALLVLRLALVGLISVLRYFVY
ncbi:YggT family protein [Paenibacillus sp. JGP012]|uniref:Membrane protein n=2 Tax=Paenibacillus silvae TaxID=1325358 RepID=A0ABQ1Z0J8_9BACL|nr:MULTISPECIES: YggT family protein [Paenibacillus]MBB6020590.1 YggT family protein [Paenibacillus sp. JGP012]MBU5354263.1 YggT family protein [Paenibacillus barcinonensis]MCK6075513.1 YggT family protein [Paenibacillus silvae]MCK6149900.1 YggT family protein [Paenibacillus silvae]MCK6268198.1 YggT family protein [Paenibacillus silvae]